MNPGAFRLALALMVVLDHFFGLLLGRAAVYVFFVLSGYWIARMWTDRYADTASPYLTFIASRFWRLAPVMLAATFIAGAIASFVLGADLLAISGASRAHHAFSSMFFIGYAALPSPRWLEPAWSLDIEMRFYLIAPFLAAFMNRVSAARFLIVLACISALDWMVAGTGLKFLILFAIGMAAAHAKWEPSRAFAITSLMGGVAVIGAVVVSGFSDILFDRAFYTQNTALNWAVALLATPYALATCTGPSDARDRMFGDLSYSIYLVHWPLVMILRAIDGATIVTAYSFIAASFVLAYALLVMVDRPVQKWRARWVSSQEKPTPLAAIV